MARQKIKKIEKASIVGFQKHFLEKMIDFFENNTGKFIYYICDIEDIEPDVLKLDLNALNNLRRKKIIKKTGVKQGKKADVLNVGLSAPCKLEIKVRGLNKGDMAIEADKNSDLCFYHRLDNPCVYVELERSDIDINKAVGYLLSLSPDLYKPVRNKQGKFFITISKSEGIYYDEKIKKYKYYAPLKNSKRYKLIQLLLKSKKAEKGDFLRDYLKYKEYSKLSHEIDEINLLFKERLLFKEDLIIRENAGGYNINFNEYSIMKTE